MITAADLKVASLTNGRSPDWVAYTMVEANPWPLGFMLWKHARWAEVRADLGLSVEAFPAMPGELFGDQFIEKCAAAVRKRYAG